MADLPDGPALIVVGGPTDGEVYPLDKDRSIIVGSGRLANLRLGPADISSAHLKVAWDDGGLFVNDNTSFTGTWLNGESVEQAPLQDGDTLAFADAKEKPDWPRLRIHVPPGSVIITAPPAELEHAQVAPPEEKATAPAPAERPRPLPRPPTGRGPARGRAPAPGFTIPGLSGFDPKKAVAIGGGGLALVLSLFALVRFFFGPTPRVESVLPGTAEPGQSVTLAGDLFAVDPAQSVVRFGETEGKVTSGGETSLTVVVPDAAAGDVALTVQVGRRRSKPAPFVVLKALRISSLEPEVALPGEEVTIKGSGLDSAGLTLAVEGKTTPLFDAQSTSARFKVPALATSPVRGVPLLLRTKEQVAKPFDLTIGKLPLVLTVNPRSVEPGGTVALEGKGFAPNPAENHVLFGQTPALVLAATPTKLTVVAPDLGMAGPAPLLVEARGRSNTAAVPVQVGAGSSATYRLRFYAAPAEGVGRALVATAAGPVLLLATKDDAASVEQRAVNAAAALNTLADAASLGRAADVEARNPSSLAVVGGAVIARATGEDAAAYSTSAASLAAHWAALVGDYLAMFGRGERPTRLFATTARARALLELQSEVGFRPGTGVAAVRMARLSPDAQQKLKDLALLLAAPAQGQAGAAVEGIWEGQLQDGDGVVKAVVVEMRLAGGRLAGTLALGSKVAVKIPLQEIVVQGGSLTFSVRRGGTVHAFAGALGTGEVSGPIHEGSLKGPAVGRLSLRYTRPPG